MRTSVHTILFCLAAISAVACKDTFILYDTGQKGHLYFETSGNQSVSFSLIEDTEMTYNVPFKLMGMPYDTDKEFKVTFLESAEGETIEVGTDKIPVVTAVMGKDFETSSFILPAGQVEGTITLTLHRQEIMQKNYVSIWMRIEENEDFRPLAPDDSDQKKILTPEFRLFVSDGDPVCPAWWAASKELLGWQMYSGKFHAEKYRKFLELFWGIEEVNPVFYQTCVDMYGRNLDKEDIPMAFFATTNATAWATYVLIPLYEYYKKYYAEHPDDPNVELMEDRGAIGTYWKNPIGLLR